MTDGSTIAEDVPFQRDPAGLLRRLVDAGNVRAVQQFLDKYSVWITKLEGADRIAFDSISASLHALKSIEEEHGPGSTLTLAHPLNRWLLTFQTTVPCFTEQELENANARARSLPAVAQ